MDLTLLHTGSQRSPPPVLQVVLQLPVDRGVSAQKAEKGCALVTATLGTPRHTGKGGHRVGKTRKHTQQRIGQKRLEVNK